MNMGNDMWPCCAVPVICVSAIIILAIIGGTISNCYHSKYGRKNKKVK
jgi:hypothetical protein